MLCQWEPKQSEKKKCRQRPCGGTEPQGCTVLEVSHSRCCKKLSNFTEQTHLKTHTHRQGTMGSNRKRTAHNRVTQTVSVWMMSWAASSSWKRRRVSLLNGFWVFSWQPEIHLHLTLSCSEGNAMPGTQYRHKYKHEHAASTHTTHWASRGHQAYHCQNCGQRFVHAMPKSLFFNSIQFSIRTIINGACQKSGNL